MIRSAFREHAVCAAVKSNNSHEEVLGGQRTHSHEWSSSSQSISALQSMYSVGQFLARHVLGRGFLGVAANAVRRPWDASDGTAGVCRLRGPTGIPPRDNYLSGPPDRKRAHQRNCKIAEKASDADADRERPVCRMA